jgi:NADPH:quinone reductase-like Zn-dependent oxidoreductase
MKAVICTKYGSPKVLQIREYEKPVPKDNEVLIRIKATVAAPADSAFRMGKPAAARLFTGLSRPKQIPGDVLSGIIEAAGKDVKSFKAGDEVYGSSGTNFGTNAEYIVLPEDAALALKPNNIGHGEAAAISEGSLTALPFLRDTGKIKNGCKVLINGASGGVGVLCCSTGEILRSRSYRGMRLRQCGLVKRLGADKVIDYTKEDFAKKSDTYDIILMR